MAVTPKVAITEVVGKNDDDIGRLCSRGENRGRTAASEENDPPVEQVSESKHGYGSLHLIGLLTRKNETPSTLLVSEPFLR
jgi:hypothetical protein